MLWNTIEELLKKEKIDRRELSRITPDIAQKREMLLTIRNNQVHSTSVERGQIEYGIELAEELLGDIKERTAR